MKKMIALLLALAALLGCTACGQKEEAPTVELDVTEMRAICELSTMDCYYHNVAKYFEKDAQSGCLGIGITLYCLRDSFRFILSDVPEVQMILLDIASRVMQVPGTVSAQSTNGSSVTYRSGSDGGVAKVALFESEMRTLQPYRLTWGVKP